jgi:Bacterial PH domain
MEEIPGKLKRTAKKLEADGEEPMLIVPAIVQRYASEQMMAMVRMGMLDKIFGYLLVTKKNIHFIRPGLMWDKVQSIPLDQVTDIEYIKEFTTNTLKLNVGEQAENIIFYDDVDGIKFYQYIRFKGWKEELQDQVQKEDQTEEKAGQK